MWFKLFISFLLLFGLLIFLRLSQKFFVRLEKNAKINYNQRILALKITRFSAIIATCFILISIWGVEAKNIWVFMTTVIGFIAIGFVAVWSILSNVISGILLLVISPFKIGDKIEMLPDGIRGEVLDIQIMFVELKSDQDTLHIPNNFFFQKIIKKINCPEQINIELD